MDYSVLDSIQFLDDVLRLTYTKLYTLFLMQPQPCYIQGNCHWCLSEGLLRKPNSTGFKSFFFFFSVRKHNALTFSGWSIFIFDFEITSCFAFFFFLIILYILWTCVWHPGWKEASSDLNSCTDIHCCIFTPLHTANQTVTYKPYHYSIIYFIIYYCFIFYLSTLL